MTPVKKTGKLPKDIFGSTETPNTTKSDQDLVKLLEELREAYLSSDANVIDRIYADDCIVTNANGAVGTKAELMEVLRSGDLRYESYNREELILRFYGNTAVTSSIITSQGWSKGRDFRGRSRVISVWIKQGGKWRFVAGQGTPIAQK